MALIADSSRQAEYVGIVSQPCLTFPAHTIHLLHDCLGPLHTRRYELVRPWASLRAAEEIVGSLHVQAGQDGRHDADHAFAAFVHADRLPPSPCVRHGYVLISSMTNDVRQHLIKVEAGIQSAKPLLGRHRYPDDYRTVVVIGFIAQLVEHHQAVLVLIAHDMIGSAFALARPIMEGMYRGLWINVCATEAEITRFTDKDEIRLSMAEMARAIDESYRGEGFFQNLKVRSWDALNSYTHTGMLQLGRRFTEHEVRSSYTDGQIVEMTTASTTCVLILISRFLAKQNHGEEMRAVDALIETYGPLARIKAEQEKTT